MPPVVRSASFAKPRCQPMRMDYPAGSHGRSFMAVLMSRLTDYCYSGFATNAGIVVPAARLSKNRWTVASASPITTCMSR
jgi:hypothetical protein